MVFRKHFPTADADANFRAAMMKHVEAIGLDAAKAARANLKSADASPPGMIAGRYYTGRDLDAAIGNVQSNQQFWRNFWRVCAFAVMAALAAVSAAAVFM